MKALNDYLLIIDYMRHNMASDFYARLRTITMYQIGCIFYKERHYDYAMEFFCPITLELQRHHCNKQYHDCAKKVGKIWTLKLKALDWNYFYPEIIKNENEDTFDVINHANETL